MEDDYVYNKMRERIGALTFLALGVFAFWAIGGKSIGTQLFPRLVSGAIVVIALTIFVRSFLAPPAASAPASSDAVVPTGRLRGGLAEEMLIFLAFGLTIIYIFGIQYVGFSISTLLFIPICAFVFGYRNWIAILLGAAGFVAFTTIMFRYVFYILLPEPLLRL